MADFKFRNLYEIEQAYDILDMRGEVEFSAINRLDKKIEDINYYTKCINDFIYDIRDDSYYNSVVDDINEMLSRECITASDIVWLDIKNTRLINFSWAILNMVQKNRAIDNHFKRNEVRAIINAFDMTACSFKEREQDIREWFLCGNVSKHDKLEILDNLKVLWEKSIHRNTIDKTLDIKDKQQCEWFYQYINNKFDNNKLLIANIEKDYYWSIINYFDCLLDIHEYENCLSKIKKAWSQRKYKLGNNGAKEYSYSMSIDIDPMVTEMAKKLGISKCKVVEISIKTEFERFKNTTK
ncbi:hypothetical protein [Photobacterium damselae]|uniref:hypothetical protein n=1 Tax=Photobacterium damselae TaxID=38293 RepID=UPI001F2B8385|nr:hypothetical protein [Photobacterium damselae]UKA03956.1 hypothetical protein IHC89_15620 [Photobacterium damselae subsp. damselae]